MADGGAAAGIDHEFEVTVSGGEVRWSVSQQKQITPGSAVFGGCQVNGRPFPGGGGILEPGQHEITFDCGGGAAESIGSPFEADYG